MCSLGVKRTLVRTYHHLCIGTYSTTFVELKELPLLIIIFLMFLVMAKYESTSYLCMHMLYYKGYTSHQFASFIQDT